MVVAFILKYLQVIKLRICSFIFILLLVYPLSAQNTDITALKDKRQQYEKEINNAKKLLIQKGNSRKSVLNQLKVLNAQIEAQNSVIATYRSEINNINVLISKNQKLIKSLEDEILQVKKAYEKLILEANKQKSSNYNEFMLLFSSKSFSEAYRRFNLMKQYASYRKKQGQILIENKLAHDSIMNQNKLVLRQKENSYDKLIEEIEDLKIAKSNKQKYISDLKRDESWLKNEIAKKTKAAKKLQESIEKLISESITESNYSFSNFNNAKGKLNWPVANGIVTSLFGEHNHSILKGVKVKNNGIDITASKENPVKSIYEGTVSRVIAIPGYNKAVIIRHGKYLTVYANLVKVNVKKGQVVKNNENIGQIFAEAKEGSGILHFEIWEENKKINPLDWLKK